MQNADCFEFVLGTLRGDERTAFIQQLQNDPQLQADVRFWEEHLMAIQDKHATQFQHMPVPPSKDTWEKITRRINNLSPEVATSSPTRRTRLAWLWPVAALCATLVLAVLIVVRPAPDATLNADYVAVLTDSDGKALLTALTTGEGQTMWLKWNEVSLPEDASAQLWAVSRRDGEVRPIAVFEKTDVESASLSEARWRLIQDAEYLLLTEEEAGGSPLDEPSEKLLAKGVCVRLRSQESS